MKVQQIFFSLTLFCFLISCKQTDDQLLHKANALSKEGRHEKAIELYTTVIKRNKKLQVAWYNRGLAYLTAKKYQHALADLNKAISLIPQEGYSVVLKGKVDYVSEEMRGQVPYFDVLYQLAQAKFYVDSLESSFSDFQFLTRLNYNKASCLLWQGAILVKKGQADSACALFKSAKQFAATELEIKQSNEATNVYCGQ